MSLADGIADLGEECYPLRERQRLLPAIAVDGFPVDQLEHKIRRAVFGHVAVDQAGDAGMFEPRENGLLGPETG